MKLFTLFLLSVSLPACFTLEKSPERQPSSNTPPDLISNCSVSELAGYPVEVQAEVCIFQFKKTVEDRIKNKNHKDKIIYFLHGAGGNARSWVDNGHLKSLSKEWDSKVLPPSFISIDFLKYDNKELKGVWFLFDRLILNSNKPQLVTIFNDQQKQIEKNLQKTDAKSIADAPPWNIQSRMILGESMGGRNTTFALTYGDPSFQYQRGGVLCALVYNISPHSTESEIDNFIQVQKKNIKNLNEVAIKNYITGYLKSIYPTQEEWLKYNLVQAFKELKQKPKNLYFSANKQDSLGLYPGDVDLASAARSLNPTGNIESHEIDGDHCRHDFKSMAQFFAEEMMGN